MVRPGSSNDQSFRRTATGLTRIARVAGTADASPVNKHQQQRNAGERRVIGRADTDQHAAHDLIHPQRPDHPNRQANHQLARRLCRDEPADLARILEDSLAKRQHQVLRQESANEQESIARSDFAKPFRTPEERRQVSNAEINRELTILKRAFSLAIQAGKLMTKPHIPLLKESNARTGFFELDQFQSVVSHLPDPIRPVVKFAYVTGWRIPSEVLTLQWRQIDFGSGQIRLDPGTTKNGEGRVFLMTAALREVLEAQRDARDRLRLERG
jgi:integrase